MLTKDEPTTPDIWDHAHLLADIVTHTLNNPLAHNIINSISKGNPPTGWHLQDNLLCFEDRTYVPDQTSLRLQVIRNHHDHPTSGHFGQRKMAELVGRAFYWRGLKSMINKYMSSCTTCTRSKTPRHKPYGLLKQLPIPIRPWNSISMDFIEQLPISNGHSSILVVVDCLTKLALFIPTNDAITSPKLSQLFLTHVFTKHRAPTHVTSDCSPEFISHFFQSLGTLLKMELHFTSGHHPEGDSQTERVNQVLEQYLRSYTNYQQDNWSSLLPLAEIMLPMKLWESPLSLLTKVITPI